MDWDSYQNLESMSIWDDNWWPLMDSNPFGVNQFDDPVAATGNQGGSMPSPFDAEEDLGGGNNRLSLQFNFDFEHEIQFMPTNDTFQPEGTYSNFEGGYESQGASDAATTPSVWGSSNAVLSPLGSTLSASPLDGLGYQVPGIPYHNGSQTESFELPMPIARMNRQTIPMDIQRQRGRRKRKPSGLLTKDERKIIRPEKCHICEKGHAQKRDLDRHLVSNHPAAAKRLGLDVSKIACRICGFEFDKIRHDRLTRHMKTKHTNIS